MISRFLAAIVVIAAAIAATVLVWPQLFGLQNTWVIAQIVSLRGLGIAATAVLIVLLLILAAVRSLRPLMVSLALVGVLFVLANAGILALRGLDNGSETGEREAASTEGSITVLAWNTMGEVPGVESIAALTLETQADIVALPETTDVTATEVAIALREAGQPMWVVTSSFDLVAKARSTTLLISPNLGDYTVVSEPGSGPPGNTNVLPTVVAVPTNGEGPVIIGAHAVAPIEGQMANWRSDLGWLAERCASGNVIMAGDFNATIDNMAGHGIGEGTLGVCRDAAEQAGAAAIGTWHADWPQLLGAPIDHVFASPNWQVDSFRVVGNQDQAGSDHRPIVAVLSPRGEPTP